MLVRKTLRRLGLSLLLCLILSVTAQAAPLDAFDQKVKGWAESCRDEIVSQFDHALVLFEEMPIRLVDELKNQFERIIITDYNPTSEMEYFANSTKGVK